MDLALMYTPRYIAGLHVERLFDEKLVLISSDPEYSRPDDAYIYVDWGPSFYAQHLALFPDIERPPQVANIGRLALQVILENGGACFVPDRLAARHVQAGRLHLPPDAPTFSFPAYIVYPTESDSAVLQIALAALRTLASELR